ncbi:anchored repeat ABC transporter, substrate-binding protein [Streptomyces sp. YIM 98790]|uniref:anchored repeat ABC transporter, substrate-binding protein n=1 Tax=Streptomyces sp. YIM 98790 TaxID=2689077 RepID=UPI00140AC0C7|nr:anchored repeat ABC transporter, substrate-binding protein [Streptomyces sp. YIM 98790]
MTVRHRLAVILTAAGAVLAAGCSGGSTDEGGGPDAALTVSTTTPILADLVTQVGGERVRVSSIVPHHGDPHSYEPSPADTVKVTQADLVFGNGLLLEEPGIMRMVHSNAADGVPVVEVTENLEEYGGTVIPLREDLDLDVLWLGLAVEGAVPGEGSQVRLTATALDGPGEMYMYLTDTFGTPQVFVDSSDGFDGTDTTTLPPEAHTHLNWAFTEPGTYRLELTGQTEMLDGRTEPIDGGTLTFTVGPSAAQGTEGRTVLDSGHADVALNAETGTLAVRADDESTGERVHHAAGDVVIAVPDEARETVPAEEPYRFLGEPGAGLWVLPQAVLGQHVHGELDPHAWADVSNAEAYVRRIQEALTAADPDGAAHYADRAESYLRELAALDAHIRERIATIPQENRQLITTHDAFGYLARAYGMEVAGFVVPVPGQEPSAADIEELGATIAERDVPAVFVEPNLASRADVLRQVASDQGVQVCVIYGDAFDDEVENYLAMMRHNADELARCLA